MTPYPSLTTDLEVKDINYSDSSYDLKPEKIQGFVKDLEAAGTYQIEVYVALINSPDWVNRFWFEFETDSDFINSATNNF